MARGWESKDVEAQVESTEQKKQWSSGHEPKSAGQVQQEQQRGDLELSRIRIVHDLESATNPHHRKSLEAALAHLDKQLAALK
ncbi:MAG TPA: hypothetical protein VGI16_10960 [Candidatus Acidoferrum sp.]|jgi:hypothetical protein